jgi:hypothetical protein
VCDGVGHCANGDPAASGAFVGNAAAYAVSTYASGDALIAGDFEGPLDLGGGSLSGSGAGNRDAFVTRRGASGSHVWSRSLGGIGNQIAFSAAVGPAGEAIVGGMFTGMTDFGAPAGMLTSGGGHDGYLLKLDANGNTAWARRFGDGLEQVAIGVGIDATGAVYVGGWFAGTINLGGADLVSVGQEDVFIAKLDANGMHVWSHRFGDGNSQVTGDFACRRCWATCV